MWGANSIRSTAISMSILPLMRLWPDPSVNRFTGFVTTEKPL